MENLDIYNKYRTVPQEACKDFSNGKFSGTDINTMWRIKCLTELFGPVGSGWYFTLDDRWTEEGASGEIMAFVKISLYYKLNGEWSKPLVAVGGNTLVKYSKKNDYLANSDEAYKMAVTDAFGVACKYLGFGADIYWENDKTKYTQNYTESRREEIKTICKKNNVPNGIVKEIAEKQRIKDLDSISDEEYEQYKKELSAWKSSTES